jgi:HEPN domain-containing protein
MPKTKTLLYQHLCFHAQQAAEKALKAALVHHGVRIPRSHDLTFLMDLLPRGISLPPALIELPRLTKYAVQQRYPAEVPPPTAKHRREALVLAEETVRWAARLIRSS